MAEPAITQTPLAGQEKNTNFLKQKVPQPSGDTALSHVPHASEEESIVSLLPTSPALGMTPYIHLVPN